MADLAGANAQRRAHTVETAASRIEAALDRHGLETGGEGAADENGRELSDRRQAEIFDREPVGPKEIRAESERRSIREADPTERQTSTESATSRIADLMAADAGEETAEADAPDTVEAAELAETAETEAESDAYQYSTLNQLAADLGEEPAALLDTLTHEINGKPVKLSEIVENFDAGRSLDMAKHAPQAVAAFHEGGREFSRQSAKAGQLINTLLEVTQAEANDPALVALRENNPGEWAARSAVIQNKVAAIQGVAQEYGAEYDAMLATQQRNALAATEKVLSATVPGWGDAKMNDALGVLSSLGISKSEVPALADPRLFAGALELAELRAFKAAAEGKAAKPKATVKAKARTAPKAKPKLRPKATAARSNVADMRAKLAQRAKDQRRGKRTGGTDTEAAAAFLEAAGV